jgi:hypothetical protein
MSDSISISVVKLTSLLTEASEYKTAAATLHNLDKEGKLPPPGEQLSGQLEIVARIQFEVLVSIVGQETIEKLFNSIKVGVIQCEDLSGTLEKFSDKYPYLLPDNL